MSEDVSKYIQDDSFRDSISTVNKEGKRVWIFPKKPFGKFYNFRTWLSYFLLLFLFSGPFIKINGEPLLMLNILERKFVILGQIFWPQDFHLFALSFIIGVVFIVVFTIAFGRLFCGWVCPQTIFMEMLFRKIEYWIDGDYNEQKRLDNSPWTAEKWKKRLAKWSIFYAISFLISNVFLAYIIGSDALLEIITDPPSKHISGLVAIVAFSGVFFFVFHWLREQVCTTVCPYGRLQGVLLDKNSIVVAYDYLRGEKRGKLLKQEDRKTIGKGDCIDCKLCVHVCPTGIDIRNGTQLECTNCTACIDACDHIMEKVGFEKGLIRYASENEIANKQKFAFTFRIVASSIVLGILLVLFSVLLFTRTTIETTVLRTPGMLYQEHEDGKISNLYNFKLVNKSNEDMDIELKLMDDQGSIKLVGKNIHLPKQGLSEGGFFIYYPSERVRSMKNKIKIGVYANGKLLETINTTFVGKI